MSVDVVKTYGLDMTGSNPGANDLALAAMAGDIKALSVAGKPLPRYVFSEGICAFGTWPNLAFTGLQLKGEGQVVLKHTSSGDA